MKKLLLMAAIAASVSPSLTAQNGGEAKKAEVVQSGIRFCESTYPYQDGILVANFGTEELNPLNNEGKGYILYLKGNETKTFIAADGNLSGPKGMLIEKQHLFVCDVNKVVVYNLDKPQEKPQIVSMPEGNLFVNDLVAADGTLYISVTNTDKIFKADIKDVNRVGEPVEWLTVPGPNGLLLDKGTMYIASYPADGNTQDKHVIYRVNDLKNPKAEKLTTVPGQYDGIALSGDGKSLYITNWTPAGISKVCLKTGKTTPLKLNLDKELIGPADITVKGGKIYIPDLPNSRVVIINE